MHSTVKTARRPIRSVIMIVCALVLFVAGLFLLFAPAHRQVSRCGPDHFPGADNGWIMGAQSFQANFLAGG